MNKKMVEKLVELATTLDAKGAYDEVNELDGIIKKLAQEGRPAWVDNPQAAAGEGEIVVVGRGTSRFGAGKAREKALNDGRTQLSKLIGTTQPKGGQTLSEGYLKNSRVKAYWTDPSSGEVYALVVAESPTTMHSQERAKAQRPEGMVQAPQSPAPHGTRPAQMPATPKSNMPVAQMPATPKSEMPVAQMPKAVPGGMPKSPSLFPGHIRETFEKALIPGARGGKFEFKTQPTADRKVRVYVGYKGRKIFDNVFDNGEAGANAAAAYINKQLGK